MNTLRATYEDFRRHEPSLLMMFTLKRLAEKEPYKEPGIGPGTPDKQDKGPTKPAPEIIPPSEEGDKPDVRPEMPNAPNVPEIGPGTGPDVVEVPVMPTTPETGVPARDLPGGILH